MNEGHPECPERLESIMKAVSAPEFSGLIRILARKASVEDLLLAHTPEHVTSILEIIPNQGLNFIDNDTMLCPLSGVAAFHAAGAVLDAVECVLAKPGSNAFCAVRPPGHHAHRDHAAGFCLFNNVAIGALSALERHGLSRVAIIDFDVHHGDGTQDIMWDEKDVLFISTHQSPLYPGTGRADERGAHGNIVNFPLPAGTGGDVFRDLMTDEILPRLNDFKPDMIFVSAGFDAHKDEQLASLALDEDDFAYLMKSFRDAAENLCQGRLVAVLEGGYNLNALGNSVAACLRVMM